jgi:hypothetical protein
MLVFLAIIMAFAEAVMALGAGQSSGLVASDIWTLLVGQTPSFTVNFSETLSAASSGIMAMPAWIVFGAVGAALAQFCRKRRDRRRIFRTIP